MYQIFFDQYTIHDPRDDVRRIREPDAHLAVGEAGSLAFTIDSDHPHAEQLTRIKGVVELRAAGRPIFKGRIRRDTREFNLTRRIEAEGLLACLNDSFVGPFSFPEDFLNDPEYQAAAASGNVVEYFLGWLLTRHNIQVGPAQQIQLGTVTVADPNNYITRASSEYLTTMDAVKKKLVDLLGGYLVPDYSGSATILHYYADLPLTNVQEVEFGENLLDLTNILDSADTCTAILPQGAEGLTLKDLPDGEISPGIWKAGLVVYSKETEEALGGRITRIVKWDNVTLDSNLQTKAAALLTGDGIMTAQTLTVKAVDLGFGNELPHFSVGRYVKLTSTPHGISASYPLMELDPDILDPGNTQITMGVTIKTASDIAHAQQSANQEQQDRLQLELNRQESSISGLAQTFTSQLTNAIQNSEYIMLEAMKKYVATSDFESFQKEMEAEFKVMAEKITMTFTTTTERITEVDGELQRTVEELIKHFDFSGDGLVIRDGKNTLSLTLDNGLIMFRRNGQQFGWWDGVDFHTGNIVIDVNERAQFGNFAFVPRSNGSLSFLKVGG